MLFGIIVYSCMWYINCTLKFEAVVLTRLPSVYVLYIILAPSQFHRNATQFILVVHGKLIFHLQISILVSLKVYHKKN